MSRSNTYLACGLLGAYFLVFATWLVTGWGGPATVTKVSDLGSLLASSFAVVCAALTARVSRGRQRWAWTAVTVGLSGWFLGDAVYAFADLVVDAGTVPFPSAADAGYLIFPLATCVGLIMLPIGGVGQSQVRLVLDGLIVAASLFVICWTSGLEGVLRAGDATPFAFAVSVAYPITDLVLITMAVLVLIRARPGQRAGVTVLCVALAAMAMSDGAFVVLNADDDYASGNLIDVGWMAGLLLLCAAAMIGARSRHVSFGLTRAPSQASLWLPYVPLPVAVACLVNSQPSITLLVSAMVLVFAVMGRQFIVSEENRRLLREVAAQAFRDQVTGMANRALFRDRLCHAAAMQIRDGREIAVLSIDLDDFKLVNDSFGHPAGDALLKGVAERIAKCVRTGDTVARIGGDEFAVLLEEGEEGAESPLIVAHRIFDAFDQPFDIEGHDVFMRPSVGVAVKNPATPADDSGDAEGSAETSAETLLRQADLAMYAAKRGHHGGVHPFTTDMTLIDVREVDPPRDRRITARRSPSPGLQLFAQLRRAIDQDELSLVYQPKFTVSTGRVEGVEALVRWEHPQRGLMLPGDFLPLARQNGLMGALTEAVVHRAVQDAAGWRAQGRAVPFAINLFPPSLGDLDLPERILRILDVGGIAPGCLTVEITEDFLLGNVKRACEVLEMLRASGIRVSIDDFGTGYSALSYLRELPIDEIKLDRQFIAPILLDERADTIVSAIVDLAHRLDMLCVAEGVEDAVTATRLADHGCDVIQGHFCSWPVAASEVTDVRPMAPLGGAARLTAASPGQAVRAAATRHV